MAMPDSYCLFDSPIGPCAIAWREAEDGCAVTHLVLPESTPERTEERMARHTGARRAHPPPAIAALVARIRGHLRGELDDLLDVAVDLTSSSEFDRLVYDAARRIPPGETRTYGEIGKLVSLSFQPLTSDIQLPVSRSVGQALARNPIPIIIPCHRVLAANGRLGGFSAPGALRTKTRLLQIEGAKFPELLAFPPASESVS